MFNEQKTAQMAAFFLYKSENCMPVLKLIKLLLFLQIEHPSIYTACQCLVT